MSWIATQFLTVSPEYSAGFSKLIAAAKEGRPVTEAFTRAFGRGPDVVDNDVRSYLGQKAKLVREFPHSMSTEAPGVEVVAAGEFEVALVTTDLLSVMGKENKAKTAFAALNGRFSGAGEIQRAPERRAARSTGKLQVRPERHCFTPKAWPWRSIAPRPGRCYA